MLPSHVIGPNFLDSRARLSFLNMLMAIFDNSCSDSSVWVSLDMVGPVHFNGNSDDGNWVLRLEWVQDVCNVEYLCI